MIDTKNFEPWIPSLLVVIASLASPVIVYFMSRRLEPFKHSLSKNLIYSEKRVEVLSEYYSLLSIFFDLKLRSLAQPHQTLLNDNSLKEDYSEYKKSNGDSISIERFAHMVNNRKLYTEAEEARVKMMQYYLKSRPWLSEAEEKMIDDLNDSLYKAMVDYKNCREDLGGSENVEEWRSIWEGLNSGDIAEIKRKITKLIRGYYN